MSVPFINIYVLFLPPEGYICHGSANKVEKQPSGINATFYDSWHLRWDKRHPGQMSVG